MMSPDIKDDISYKTIDVGRYGPSVAQPVANLGMEVKFQARLVATFNPWVAPIVISSQQIAANILL